MFTSDEEKGKKKKKCNFHRLLRAINYRTTTGKSSRAVFECENIHVDM